MKISQVVTSIDISTGGPARSVTHLISNLCKNFSDKIVTLDTLKSDKPIINDFEECNAKVRFNAQVGVGYSKELKSNLEQSEQDLFHGQGIWQMPVHQMAKIARKKRVPYIITPRGMLEPWSLEQSKLKKKIAFFLFQHKDLKKAACLHATALSEAESIRKLGYKNPIAVIPNGINLDEFPPYNKEKKEKKKILFLSRIHPKKGIELLFEAWDQLTKDQKNNWEVEIIGNGDKSYINQLKELLKAKGLAKEIIIKDPVFGQDKVKAYQSADLFVLPTYSENFGIVIAEALACNVPVITTKGTPWEDLEKENCGKWIAIGLEPLRLSLIEMMNKSDEELILMGVNGRKLIEKKYSMLSVAKQMERLYNWIVNKEVSKPNFVKLD